MTRIRNFQPAGLWAIAIFLLVFLLPVYLDSWKAEGMLNWRVINADGQLSGVIFRSLLYAILTSIFNIVLGFAFALILKKIKAFSLASKCLSLLILPIILGNTAAVFMVKVLFLDAEFFGFIAAHGFAAQLCCSLVFNFWQFGLLSTYLFWLTLNRIPTNQLDYAKATGLHGFEIFKDILLPHCKNLIILLLMINFLTGIYDDVKTQFLFHSSIGMNNELLNHWLGRIHLSHQQIFPLKAGLISQGRGTLIAGLMFFLLLIYLFSSAYFLSTVQKLKFRGYPGFKLSGRLKGWLAAIVLFLLVFVIIGPVTMTVLKLSGANLLSIFILWKTLLMSFLAAMAASLLAIVFTSSLRLYFKNPLAGSNIKSYLTLLGMYVLQMLPPVCITLASFKWMSWIGYGIPLIAELMWLVAHCLVSFPILGSFLLVTHFAVKTNELDYLQAYKIPGNTILKSSFFIRFKAEYIFTVIFAFAYIWNDAKVNLVFSEYIPSYVSSLSMLVSGKGFDYGRAMPFFLVGVILAVLTILSWNFILQRKEGAYGNG